MLVQTMEFYGSIRKLVFIKAINNRLRMNKKEAAIERGEFPI
jgi:hypothetical protein